MLRKPEHIVRVEYVQNQRHILFRIFGNDLLPATLDLINSEGRKVHSVQLLYGTELAIPKIGLINDQYLFVVSFVGGTLLSGTLEVKM